MSNSNTKNNLGTFYTNLGKAVNTHINNVGNSVSKTANSMVNATTNALNSASNSASKTLNSLVPLTANKKNNSLLDLFKNQTKNTSTANANVTNATTIKPVNELAWPIILFLIITGLTIFILVKFKTQISASVHNIGQKIRDMFNKPTTPAINGSLPPISNVTDVPVSPQQTALTQQTIKKTTDIIDKIIPLGNPEVYNVSKNDFTYYDAEPLCRALGAELATYDQVKAAFSKGADWCNYGWVKGQAAVYPTQEDTYNKVQAGPEEDRNSCGTVGLNGGYFDNPELKFGVNCYGVKPPQSEHDEEVLMKQGNIPKSVPSLAIDKKVQEFKKEAGNLGVLPFNGDKWDL